MPQYNWTAPDGTNHVIDGEGTSAELIQVRRMWEEQQAKGAKPSGTAAAFMSEPSQREVIERAATNTEAQIQARQSALESERQDFAGSFSGAGAMAGAVRGGALAGRMAAPAGPAVAAGATAIGGALGGAVGAFGGQYGGAKLMGTTKTDEQQLNDALDAANLNATIDVGLMGAGAAARTVRAEVSPYTRAAVDKLFSLKTPETLAKIARNRAIGLRTTPADINPKLAKVFGTIFSVIPAISNPLRAAKARRGEEIKTLIDGLTGPLESGLNEMAISQNYLAAATRAHSVRKDWYDRIYGELRGYMAMNPQIEINNDSIDAVRNYFYEQAKQSRPVNIATTTRGAVETRARTTAAKAGASGSEVETSTQSLRSRNAGVDYRYDLDEQGRPYVSETPVEPRAAARDTQSAVSKEQVTRTQADSTSLTRREIERTTEETYRTAGFSNPGKIDQFLAETMNGPERLTYSQLEGLNNDINGALRSNNATPDQYRTLLQMKENLDTALEQVGDPVASGLVTRARTRYRKVMEFFENPQAKKFESVRPGIFSSVKEITKDKNTPDVVSDKLLSLLTDDLTPEGVRNLKTLVGKTNLRDAASRVIGTAVKSNESFAKDGSQVINWRGVRGQLGLDIPGSSRGAGTEELLRSSGHPLANGRLRDVLEAAETELGPNIPPIATMYARQAVFSGPKAAIRGLFATKALPLLGDPISSVMGVVALRKFSQFLADPNRLNAMSIVLSPAIKSPGTKQMAARQVIRYLAQDLYSDENPGMPPSESQLKEVEQRVLISIEEANKAQVQPRIQDRFTLTPGGVQTR